MAKSSTNYVTLICFNCQSKYTKYLPPSAKKSTYNFCSLECRKTGMKGTFTGINNSNFGNYWTDNQRNAQSALIKNKVNEEYRLNCAKGMRGKEVKEETKNKRKSTIIKRYGKFIQIQHTNESKKIIGEKSKLKFTDEFKANHYEKMVNNGNWIPREIKDPYHFYKMISNWDYDVFSFDVIGSFLYHEHGYFSRKNKNGVVRDHRFSRYSAFKLGIFPEIIKHPFNCEIIKHSDNVKKHHSKKINSDSIELDELFNGILNYDKIYEHQDICIKLIESYKNGERYNIDNYLNRH
jgi:hypothetical protein